MKFNKTSPSSVSLLPISLLQSQLRSQPRLQLQLHLKAINKYRLRTNFKSPFLIFVLALLLFGQASLFSAVSAFAEGSGSSGSGDLSQYISFQTDNGTEQQTASSDVTGALASPTDAGGYNVSDASGSSTVIGADTGTASTGDDGTYTIGSTEEFLQFASKCRDYTWSVGRVVYLTADIDLTGKSIDPIPCFCGTLYGNRHTISGINIVSSASRVGLFAALTVEAFVTELRVTGTVVSSGDGIAGGITGENSGTIQNCIFQGSVTAAYSSGAIAGINFETGTIADSKVSGTVTGKLCAGGITADNKGLLRSCENYADVSNGVSGLEKLLSPSLLSGGICGTSTGKIENCEDRSSLVPQSSTSLFPIRFTGKAVTLMLCIVLIINISGAVITIIVYSSRNRMY